MAYIKKDGFTFTTTGLNDDPDLMLITGVKLKEAINYINEKNIRSIYLNWDDSEKIKDLEFLKETPFIEEVVLNKLKIPFTGLYHLENLKTLRLSINDRNQRLDFSKLSNLASLSTNWYVGFPDLSTNSNLSDLAIYKYNPTSKSLGDLILPGSIKKLLINSSNIINFKNLFAPSLQHLECFYLSKLESVYGLEQFSDTLESIELGNCKKIKDIEHLSECSNLKKIILGECGEISNLKWIEYLKNLEFISFVNTNILDGDLSWCERLKYTGFLNKKHYSHTSEQMKAINQKNE